MTTSSSAESDRSAPRKYECQEVGHLSPCRIRRIPELVTIFITAATRRWPRDQMNPGGTGRALDSASWHVSKLSHTQNRLFQSAACARAVAERRAAAGCVL